MTWQGFVELMLFFAMVIGVTLAAAELWFSIPKPENKPPTADDEENG